jgi:hypothetical protein
VRECTGAFGGCVCACVFTCVCVFVCVCVCVCVLCVCVCVCPFPDQRWSDHFHFCSLAFTHARPSAPRWFCPPSFSIVAFSPIYCGLRTYAYDNEGRRQTKKKKEQYALQLRKRMKTTRPFTPLCYPVKPSSKTNNHNRSHAPKGIHNRHCFTVKPSSHFSFMPISS